MLNRYSWCACLDLSSLESVLGPEWLVLHTAYAGDAAPGQAPMLLPPPQHHLSLCFQLPEHITSISAASSLLQNKHCCFQLPVTKQSFLLPAAWYKTSIAASSSLNTTQAFQSSPGISPYLHPYIAHSPENPPQSASDPGVSSYLHLYTDCHSLTHSPESPPQSASVLVYHPTCALT